MHHDIDDQPLKTTKRIEQNICTTNLIKKCFNLAIDIYNNSYLV